VSFCLAPVHMKEKEMQCEASTPVCSNQGVQLLESVYMCCNKLTATCTKVNGNRLKLLTLLAKSVYICTTTFLHRVSNVFRVFSVFADSVLHFKWKRCDHIRFEIWIRSSMKF
jgi:hypothetical protein